MSNKVKASVWDYDEDKRFDWESEKPHCKSCAWDEDYGGFADDPCCCIHHMEYCNMILDTVNQDKTGLNNG